jgi:hypothetical protein
MREAEQWRLTELCHQVREEVVEVEVDEVVEDDEDDEAVEVEAVELRIDREITVLKATIPSATTTEPADPQE